MATDPKECREQAKRCLKLAAETNDPVLKTSLTDAAHRIEHFLGLCHGDLLKDLINGVGHDQRAVVLEPRPTFRIG